MFDTSSNEQYRSNYARGILWAVVLLTLLLGGCESQSPVSAKDVSVAETWGAAKNVVGLKHLFFSEQPDVATLIEAREQGVDVIINLREPGETNWDEARAVADAGLAYYNVPIAASGTTFDAVAMREISTLVQKHSDRKILLHCSSGNRAGAWLAIHLVHDHGMDEDSSITIAEKAGLTKPVMEARVREYLNDEANSPPQTEMAKYDDDHRETDCVRWWCLDSD